MSAQILQFPIRDSYDKHQVSHVHKLAVELGHDPKQAVRDFLASVNPKQHRADMAEQARRMRMQENKGEMA